MRRALPWLLLSFACDRSDPKAESTAGLAGEAPATTPTVEAKAKADPIAPGTAKEQAKSGAGQTVGTATELARVETPLPTAAGVVTDLPQAVEAGSITRFQATWTEVATFDAEVSFEALSAGVILKVGAELRALGPEGSFVADARIGADSPRKLQYAEAIRGRWPDDAWRVAQVPGDRVAGPIHLFKWRDHGKWVEQGEIDGEMVQLLGYSVRTGMFEATHQDGASPTLSLRRFASRHADPAPVPAPAGASLLDVFEVPGGTIFGFYSFFANDKPPSYAMMWSCPSDASAPGCPEPGRLDVQPAVAIGMRSLGAVARGRWNASVAMLLEQGSEARSIVIHRDKAGWTFDAVPGVGPVKQLFAVDNLLWIRSGAGDGTLWLRGETGQWRSVDPPADVDAGRTSIAMGLDGSVWLAANPRNGKHVVYRTPAKPEGLSG